MYVFFNPNPEGKSVGDCVIRAISKATNKPWEQIYIELCLQGFIMGANGGYGSNGYSMRRDQTGRYSREGAKEHMIDGLYSMMGDAQNEAERGAIQDCINRLKS